MAKSIDELMISADDHIDLWFMPKDLWTSRLPTAFRDRAPHVETRDEGREFWICEGDMWSHYASPAWFARKDRPQIALDRTSVDVTKLRPTTTDLRLADMEFDGVGASVMFPPIIPMNIDDRDLKIACVQTYNDWAVDFQATAPGRFLPCAMMIPDDPEASADEVQRVAKLGLVQANFLVGTVTLDMYKEPWDRFWDAAEDSNMVVSYHVGGGGRILGQRAPQVAEQFRRPAFNMGLGNGANSFFDPFVGLFTYGVLERHPRLRFVLGESGTGWIPFVVQEMDYRHRRVLESRTSPNGSALKRLPSEVFREQVWATYQEDEVGLHLIEFFGEGHMMWASDYPHPDSTWPWSQDVVKKETAHLSPEMRHRIVHDNAKAFYGL